MNKITKIILIVSALLGFIQVLWFSSLTYPWSVFINLWKNLQLSQNTINIVSLILISFSALVFLVILLYGIFIPTRHNDISFNSNSGKLRISQPALEKMISNKLKENSRLHNVDVKLKILGKNRHTKMFISAISTQNHNLHAQGEQIKEIAIEQLNQYLKIPIKKTVVDLTPQSRAGNKVV